MTSDIKIRQNIWLNSSFRIILIISIISMVFFNSIGINYSTAYWEDGGEDCLPTHGMGEINATYVSNTDIIIDGVDNEQAWNEVTDYLVPTAAKMNDPSIKFFISYLHIKILYDNDNVYLRLYWNDTEQASFQDGISICWNINVEDYSVSMFLDKGGVMETSIDGEFVDNWIWVFNDFYSNKSNYPSWDQCFGYDGWLERDDEAQDVESAYTYGDWIESGKNHYMVEMKRPLKTNDKTKDTQFIKNGAYELSFAILNNVGGEDHAISWLWSVNFTELPKSINGYSLFIVISLIGLCSLLIINKKKLGLNIRNL